MPELPEIETVKRGVQSLQGQTIFNVVIRNPSLRYPVDTNLSKILANCTINHISRRAKYLIFEVENTNKLSGFLIIHLGMSGRLTLTDNHTPLIKHDHVDILCNNGTILRYNDPRRFGCIVYTPNLDTSPLLKHLGPEPLDFEFNEEYLLKKILSKSTTIKQLIMDNSIVVGVGNIYACEALFLAKISPLRSGNSLTKQEISMLVKCIKQVLQQAIELGGSSLRDYKQADGSLGYFQNVHNVYGRNGKSCKVCNNIILEKRLGQRNSFFCKSCQR